jgi:hypothetical protein
VYFGHSRVDGGKMEAAFSREPIKVLAYILKSHVVRHHELDRRSSAGDEAAQVFPMH